MGWFLYIQKRSFFGLKVTKLTKASEISSFRHCKNQPKKSFILAVFECSLPFLPTTSSKELA